MCEHLAKIQPAVARGLAASLLVLGTLAALQACTTVPSADERAMAATYQAVIASPIRTRKVPTCLTITER